MYELVYEYFCFRVYKLTKARLASSCWIIGHFLFDKTRMYIVFGLHNGLKKFLEVNSHLHTPSFSWDILKYLRQNSSKVEEISKSWNKICSIKKYSTPMWTLHESSSPPLLISPLFILMIWKNSCSVFSKFVSDAKKKRYAAKSFFTRPRINYYRLLL